MAVDYTSYLMKHGCPELGCLDFYTELFGYTDAYLRYGRSMHIPVTFSEWADGSGTWRSCSLYDLPTLVEDRSDAYVSACTYFPRKVQPGRYESSNGSDMAKQLCAFVLDIDGGGGKNLDFALSVWWNEQDEESVFSHVLKPTFIVCSGGGLHLYFVLSEPVDMLERWKRELSAINNWLYESYNEPYVEPVSYNFYNDEEAVYDLGKPDRHGLTQPYRVVGSMVKEEYGTDNISAWRVGETYSITELAIQAGLNQTVFNVDEFDLSKSLRTKEFEENLSRAKQPRNHKRTKGHNPGVYKWLAKELLDRAKYFGTPGHRYTQIVSLAICARKDHVPRAQLEADAKEIFDIWCKAAKQYNLPPIYWREVAKALKMYDSRKDVIKYPRWWLSEKCGWKWESHQKRNGRNQTTHLKVLASVVRDLEYPDGSWRYRGGAPTKKQLILDYASEHPGANHSEIARALGVSRPTVVKWLKTQKCAENDAD